MNTLKIFILFYQNMVLRISYFLCFLYFSVFQKSHASKIREIIVGVNETANVIYTFKEIFNSAFIVTLTQNKFYVSNKYDFGPYKRTKRILFGPVLLGYLANLSDIFMYNRTEGFCSSRDIDLKFLTKKNKKIIIIFMGSEIRSPQKYVELNKYYEIDDTFCEYIAFSNPQFLSDEYEQSIRKVALQADKYADLIFNDNIDQISYILKTQYPWPTVVNPKKINIIKNKNEVPVVLHCPSNPVLKGTPVIRATVKQLKEEGYKFEYKEFIGVPHEEVLENLKKSDIVINELYTLVPGVFGVEAMAYGNALLTSADKNINPNLPQEDNYWMVTHYWEVYKNLKLLLDNPSLIEEYSAKGNLCVAKYYSVSYAKKFYRDVIYKELEIKLTI